MDIIGWQEIVTRLLFAFILGSATAIAKKWYKTKQFIQSNTLMALGAAMFAILSTLTSETRFSSSFLIVGISIICVGVGFSKQAHDRSTNINAAMRLWCAGAVGSMVGFGFFVPAYISILIVILTNLLFPASETNSIASIKKESNQDSKSKVEPEQIEKVAPQEIHYQCQVDCLETDEAEVLALLVQLGKEQKLTPTKISSKNLVDDSALPRTQMQIDFISDGNNSPLELQQVLINLKSKVEVSSASWLNLSSE